MDEEIIDEVTGWDTAPVAGGYAGLRELADRDFSGAVTDGHAWAFLLNGRIVGIFDGSIDSFEEADLTAHAAPAPALPLLFAMRATGGETRASYYTNETPLSEVDRTLTDGNFTGYVELSENVLSGDYYVVYYGGKSMHAAWVGASRRLVTGDEAFDLADDEVGIYQVQSVEVEVTDVPAPAEPADDADAAGDADAAETAGDDVDAGEPTAADEGADVAGGDPDDVAVPDADAPDAPASDADATDPGDDGSGAAAPADGAAESAVNVDAAGESGDGDASVADADGDSSPEEPAAEAGTEPEAVTFGGDGDDAGVTDATDAADADPTPPDASGAAASHEPAGPGTNGDGDAVTGDEPSAGMERPAVAAAAADAPADGDVFSEEERWREAKSIPALDPDETSSEAASRSRRNGPRRQAGADASARAESHRSQGESDPTGRSTDANATSSTRPRSPRRVTGPGDRTRSRQPADAGARNQLREQLQAATRRRDELEAERDELATERDELESRLEAATEARDELEAERDRLQERVDELESTVADLERELEGKELGFDDEPAHDRTMGRAAALEGTNLFVRYGDKSAPTLADVQDPTIDAAAIDGNLRLEYHTTFDTESLAVDGEAYESFLHGTMEYRFVDWLVRRLPYEIRDTGNEQALEGLYDAIPRVDRIELRGTVSVETADGVADNEFDVVLWDGMGDPLVVANLNDDRDPARAGMVRTVVEGGRDIATADDSLGAAFVVTSSYFEPEALEASAEATGGGLLSRSKRKSFVKLSRKQGFHLVLVEARNEEFYVNFPDL